ncbi:basic proline-rich protein-like [Vulpes lagopus]|uniref:basic proline-rich protein-like n=1 Tax=Vulpes lagopus TaxID=494514 RepID=UPI001BCA5946|nr:basic proline-rich protein-like [Vulpes lagopus]
MNPSELLTIGSSVQNPVPRTLQGIKVSVEFNELSGFPPKRKQNGFLERLLRTGHLDVKSDQRSGRRGAPSSVRLCGSRAIPSRSSSRSSSTDAKALFFLSSHGGQGPRPSAKRGGQALQRRPGRAAASSRGSPPGPLPLPAGGATAAARGAPEPRRAGSPPAGAWSEADCPRPTPSPRTASLHPLPGPRPSVNAKSSTATRLCSRNGRARRPEGPPSSSKPQQARHLRGAGRPGPGEPPARRRAPLCPGGQVPGCSPRPRPPRGRACHVTARGASGGAAGDDVGGRALYMRLGSG